LSVAAELEFRVRDDDAAACGDGSAVLVDQAAQPLELRRDVRPKRRYHPSDCNVLIMSRLCFGCRTKDRRLESLALAQAGREGFAGERARRAVLLPRRARKIAANDAFDRENICAAAQHGASVDGGSMLGERRDLGDDLVDLRRDHVMPDIAGELVQPPRGNLRQHNPFVRDRLRHHDVEGANAVGGDEKQAVVVDDVHLAHFAPTEMPKRK
jgi:hypothetical protein